MYATDTLANVVMQMWYLPFSHVMLKTLERQHYLKAHSLWTPCQATSPPPKKKKDKTQLMCKMIIYMIVWIFKCLSHDHLTVCCTEFSQQQQQ